MTEKEFENLKVGDKVWYVTDLWSYTETKPYELLVVGKLNDCIYITTSWLDGTHVMNFSWHKSYLTKAEALEASIERCEARIKDKEDDIAYEKKELDRYKEELAKAKEEEERAKKVWFVDFRDGHVACFDKEHWERSIESTYFKNKSYVKICDTEREAHEALADFYKGKYEQSLVKSGKARFVIRCGDKICLVQDVEKDEGNMVWVSDCDGFSLYVPKENVFSTRQEAEAELKRRLRS